MTRMRWFVAVVAGLLLTAAAAADDKEQKQTTTTQTEGTFNPADLRTVTLTVKKVDTKAHRVTFEAEVKPEANLTSSGQPIKLDQLHEGDTVRASFDPATGDVVRVDVTRSKSK